MRQSFYFCLLMLLHGAVVAQNNYVANTANSATPGQNNVLVGPGAGNSTMTGTANVFMGYNSGQMNSTGTGNAFIGPGAGQYNTSGYNNIFIGDHSGFFNTEGNSNTILGGSAGAFNQTGSRNIFMGDFAGHRNMSGYQNTYLGSSAGYSKTTGFYNTFIGTEAGYYNTGQSNVFIGRTSGYDNIVGSKNTFVGVESGRFTKGGEENTFIGYRAGYSTQGGSNTFLGFQAGLGNTTGVFNTFVGVQAGISNTTGSSNFIMGTNAGRANTTGSGNFFLGDNTGGGNTTGGFNVYLGANAGDGTGVNGDNNVAIGYESGRQNAGGVTNLFVGFRADAGANGLTNATAIGPNAQVNASNALVLGNSANVGIGTTAPTNKLHLVSGTGGQSGLRLENLTSGSSASVTNQSKFLTVDGAGNVILGSTNGSARIGASESLWQRNGSFLESSQGEAVIIGSGVNKTPIGYKLYVEQGILTEKVKVAVKNTSDWSDYVFTPSYSLRPLIEVDQFIKANGHLPGVPSAAEVVEKGVDVAKMDAKLLEKVEELTLYSIQQQKTIEHQQGQIDKLERMVQQVLQNTYKSKP